MIPIYKQNIPNIIYNEEIKFANFVTQLSPGRRSLILDSPVRRVYWTAINIDNLLREKANDRS